MCISVNIIAPVTPGGLDLFKLEIHLYNSKEVSNITRESCVRIAWMFSRTDLLLLLVSLFNFYSKLIT
jgi:hypothetical protein